MRFSFLPARLNDAVVSAWMTRSDGRAGVLGKRLEYVFSSVGARPEERNIVAQGKRALASATLGYKLRNTAGPTALLDNGKTFHGPEGKPILGRATLTPSGSDIGSPG